MFALLRVVTAWPALDATLSLGTNGTLQVSGPTAPPIDASGLVDREGRAHHIDALLLQRSARWLAGDADRIDLARQHDVLGAALAAGPVRLTDGR
ncbi:MAG: hypothetical protein OEU94_10310, partial [Aquincola sp.]|nr:hypothetical protein [Aquincola sp.]